MPSRFLKALLQGTLITTKITVGILTFGYQKEHNGGVAVVHLHDRQSLLNQVVSNREQMPQGEFAHLTLVSRFKTAYSSS